MSPLLLDQLADPPGTALVIFGTGAHARKCWHAARLSGWPVLGFADENPAAVAPVPGERMLDAAAFAALPVGTPVFVAIGAPAVRWRLMDEFASRGLLLPSLVHPRAVVSPDVAIGPGVLVAAGAVVETGSRLERGAIVDIGVLVDHDCHVEACVHLKPGQVCPPGSRLTQAAGVTTSAAPATGAAAPPARPAGPRR